MKKKFMLFLMAALMSVSAMCFASYGTDLDAENKIVDQFFAGDYKKASAVMDPSLAKEVTEERYKSMFDSLNKDFGKIVKKDLRMYQVFPDGGVLSYITDFEKGPKMVIEAAFKNANGKFTLFNFRVFDPAAQAPAQDNKNAEKK